MYARIGPPPQTLGPLDTVEPVDTVPVEVVPDDVLPVEVLPDDTTVPVEVLPVEVEPVEVEPVAADAIEATEAAAMRNATICSFIRKKNKEVKFSVKRYLPTSALLAILNLTFTGSHNYFGTIAIG